MKITIESTATTTRIDSVLCRLWKGVTESGTPCLVFVHRLSTNEPDRTDLDAELQELPAPAEVPLLDALIEHLGRKGK